MKYPALVRKTQTSWLGNHNADKISKLFGGNESATCCNPVQNLPHYSLWKRVHCIWAGT